MFDFSAYIQNEWSWAVLALMAIFVGMSKTGIQGLAILTVPLLAMTFDSIGKSTGSRISSGRSMLANGWQRKSCVAIIRNELDYLDFRRTVRGRLHLLPRTV